MRHLILITLILPNILIAEVKSITTSLKEENCIVYDDHNLHKDEPIDFHYSLCPGFGDYQVIFSGMHFVYNVEIKYKDFSFFPVDFSRFDSFPVRENIEWRYERTRKDNYNLEANQKFEDKFEYEAKIKSLIYKKHIAFHNPNMPNNKVITLTIVVRLDGNKTCLLAALEEPQENLQKARAIADNPESPCIVRSEEYYHNKYHNH